MRGGDVESGEQFFQLSDDTRSTFGLTRASLDSVQFFVDGAVAYEASTTSIGRSGRVSDGAPHVAERRKVFHRRVEIKPGTPGVVVGGDFESDAWSYLDVDFGGLTVRFQAGRGGRLLDGSGRGEGNHPVIYYAPAGEIKVDGLVYRLDRRAYAGATLVFRGAFRYHETSEDETRVLEGREVDRQPAADSAVAATRSPQGKSKPEKE